MLESSLPSPPPIKLILVTNIFTDVVRICTYIWFNSTGKEEVCQLLIVAKQKNLIPLESMVGELIKTKKGYKHVPSQKMKDVSMVC